MSVLPLKSILPADGQIIFLGDGEFDGIDLQMALQEPGWAYACRTAKNAQLSEEEEPFSFPRRVARGRSCRPWHTTNRTWAQGLRAPALDSERKRGNKLTIPTFSFIPSPVNTR
jgi:hypothetical protein